MKSEQEILAECIEEKCKVILNIESQLLSRSKSQSPSFIDMNAINLEQQLKNLQAEQEILTQRYCALTEKEIVVGTKQEIIEALDKIVSDTTTFKLIEVAGFEKPNEKE